jgi:hypothetical protein
MNANVQEMKTGQEHLKEEMKASHRTMTEMRAWQKEMNTRQQAMKACPENTEPNPKEIVSMLE